MGTSMKLIDKAKTVDLKLTIEFIQNGILAVVPCEIPDDLAKFGIQSLTTKYQYDRTLITSKAQLLKLVSDKYDELYKK